MSERDPAKTPTRAHRAHPAVLVTPPLCDPYAPLLGVPALGAALRQAAVSTELIDLNLELHESLATPAGIELLRRDAAHERTCLSKLEAGGRLRPELVRAAMGRSILEQRDLADQFGSAHAALRDPTLYRFGNDGRLGITGRVGVHHGTAALLGIPPAPFSATRALALADGDEPLPYRSWLVEVALPRLLALEPAWVGLSITFEGQLLPALALATLLRARAVPVFAGGFHLSTVGDGLRDDPALFDLVDGVLVGEGDAAVVTLDQVVREGKSLAEVAGLAHRNEAGDVVTPGAAPMPDMASLPTPDLAQMPIDRYLSPVPILPYQVSRGCYFGKCTFCNFTAVSPGYRHRPIDDVIRDLEKISKLGHCISFVMEAELPKVCSELSDDLLAAGLDLTWEIMCRLDRAMSRPVLGRMARAGCATIFFGLESASGRVNALMHKAVSGEVARRIIDDCAAAGINLVLSGIRDFPGESELEQAQTAGFYGWVHERVGDRILVSGGAHTFRLTRSSPIWNEPRAFGIEPLGLDEVGPLAVSAPYRVMTRTTRAAAPAATAADLGNSQDNARRAPGYNTDPVQPIEHAVKRTERTPRVMAPGGRVRDALMPIEELRAMVQDRSPATPPSPPAPRRDPRAFNHDLLKLALEGCNPGGFRHRAIANRMTARNRDVPAAPQRFRLDARAAIAPLAFDPGTGQPADLLHCVQPAFNGDGLMVPRWFGAVLEACRRDEGLDMHELAALVERHQPASGPPAVALVARIVPALWSAGVLETAGGPEMTR